MLRYIILLLILIGCSSPTSSDECDTVYIYDTVYVDTLVLYDTITLNDTIYNDTLLIEREYSQTLYDNNKFLYLKAKGIYSTPVEFLDYRYDPLYKYYYMINTKYQIVSL